MFYIYYTLCYSHVISVSGSFVKVEDSRLSLFLLILILIYFLPLFHNLD